MKKAEVKKAFEELGFDFPQTEQQLKAFDEKFKDYPYKLEGQSVDPYKIINQCSEMKLPDFDITSTIQNNLVNQLDEALIDGLKRKGFEFKHPKELQDFIISRCRCEDYVEKKERIYFVDDTPFFLHKYESKIITDPRITGDPYKVIGELGSFAYL